MKKVALILGLALSLLTAGTSVASAAPKLQGTMTCSQSIWHIYVSIKGTSTGITPNVPAIWRLNGHQASGVYADSPQFSFYVRHYGEQTITDTVNGVLEAECTISITTGLLKPH